MEADYPNSIALLQNVTAHNLYVKLLEQLDKDLKLSGIPIRIPGETTPEVLVSILRENIYRLLLEDFPKFLNLLYIVDVTEKQLAEASGNDAVETADLATFLVLKRIWKKVWYRENYK